MVLNLCRTEGVYFDPKKTELQHFSRRRLDEDPKDTYSVTWNTFLSLKTMNALTLDG